jgi:hypothetical protein
MLIKLGEKKCIKSSRRFCVLKNFTDFLGLKLFFIAFPLFSLEFKILSSIFLLFHFPFALSSSVPLSSVRFFYITVFLVIAFPVPRIKVSGWRLVGPDKPDQLATKLNYFLNWTGGGGLSWKGWGGLMGGGGRKVCDIKSEACVWGVVLCVCVCGQKDNLGKRPPL